MRPSSGTAEVHHPATRLVTFHPYQPVPFVIPATVATAAGSKSPPAVFQGARPSALFQVEPNSVQLLVTACTLMSIGVALRSEEHTSELQSRFDLVCRLL